MTKPRSPNDRYEILVSERQPMAERFVAWLKRQGHNADLSPTSINFVDGQPTKQNKRSNDIFASLWARFSSVKSIASALAKGEHDEKPAKRAKYQPLNMPPRRAGWTAYSR
jgi:hypothetical protein